MKSRTRAIRSRYIVALVVALWVLGFALPNLTLDGFLFLASFPLIIWFLLRLVLATVRRLRGSGARSQTWQYALETGNAALLDFGADGVPASATNFHPSRTTEGRKSRNADAMRWGQAALGVVIVGTAVGLVAVWATTAKSHAAVATVPAQRASQPGEGGRTPEGAVAILDRDLSQKQFGLMWGMLDPTLRDSVAEAAFVDCWARWLSQNRGGLTVQSIKFSGVKDAVAPDDLDRREAK